MEEAAAAVPVGLVLGEGGTRGGVVDPGVVDRVGVSHGGADREAPGVEYGDL